jgi:tetratricopeptide (TPR) repeat protein
MKADGRYRLFSIVAAITLSIGWAGLTLGCQSAGHLRQAQDAYNHAAAIDLQLAYDDSFAENGTGQFTNAVEARNEARTLYGASLAHLDMISPKEEASLKNNRLYGTVLTLKALCYWKLKEYEKALDVKKEADALADDQLIPRDKQIFQLLTALIAIDETLPIVEGMSGQAEAEKKAAFDRVEKILVGAGDDACTAAVCTIDAVLKDPTLDKAMEIYAQQLKLMALKRYFDAYGVWTGQCPPEDDPYWEKARMTLGQLEKASGGRLDDPVVSIVDSWIRKIGCSITVITE